METFDKRVAIVTGAGRGLGRSHALHLASLGMQVIVNDPGSALDGHGTAHAAADDVVAEIAAMGGVAYANYDDVSTHKGASGLVEQAVELFGGVHVVINNAGVLRDRSFGKMQLEDFDRVVAVHLGGSAYVTHAAWPHVLESGTGRVVFTSSASGLYGQFGQANYAAAKAAMVGLVNVLKQEGASRGVLVNAIAPIATTRMTQDLLPPESHASLSPASVSAVVGYLASPDCTVTGQVLEVGAGRVARAFVAETEPVEIPANATVQEVGSLVTGLDIESARPFSTSGDALARFIEPLASGRVARGA